MGSVGFLLYGYLRLLTEKNNLVSKIFNLKTLIVLIRIDIDFKSEMIVFKEDVGFIILTACFLFSYKTISDFFPSKFKVKIFHLLKIKIQRYCSHDIVVMFWKQV